MIQKYYCYTLDEKRTIQNYEKDDEIVELFTSEHELLTKFYQKYIEISTTHFEWLEFRVFDIPYLYNRSVNVLGKSVADMLSPIRDVYYNEYKKKHNIAVLVV